MSTQYRTEADVAETIKLMCALTDEQYHYICIIVSRLASINKMEEQD